MKLTKCGEVRRLRNMANNHSTELLRQMGYRPTHDGYVDVHFSDPVRGLHGATPGEVLHAFQMGMAERTIEVLFGQKRHRSGKRKKKVTAKQSARFLIP